MLARMDITDRLFVEIHPLETAGQIPRPHPVDDAHFDPRLIYKVLGMYNPSETSECYFVLANPQRQIWFIPQRHLRAFALLDSDEFFLTAEQVNEMKAMNGASAGLDRQRNRTTLSSPNTSAKSCWTTAGKSKAAGGLSAFSKTPDP